MIDRGILAERIQQRRKDLGMSQMAFAEALDTAQAQISRYETGENDPTAAVLVRIAQTLGVSLEWLVGLSEEMFALVGATSTLGTEELQAVAILRDCRPDKRAGMVEVLRSVAALCRE